MIWIRIIVTLAATLLIIYYAMLVLQCINVISFTKRKITMIRSLIPFYYWLKPEKEKQKTNNNQSL